MIETNATKVYNQFLELSSREMKKSLSSGLRKALTAVKKEGAVNLNSFIRNANKKNPKYNDTLQSGVRLTRIWENQGSTVSSSLWSFRTQDIRHI